MMRRILGGFGLFCLLALFGAPAHSAAAASTPTTNQIPSGVTVSPVIQQLRLEPGTESTTFTALLTNNTNQTVGIDIGSSDFVASGQAGGLTFLNKPSTDPVVASHQLAANLSGTPNHVDLSPKGVSKVVITLSGIDKLAPGGHYGAVIYHISNSGNASQNGGNRVNLQQAISTLVFARTNGQGTQGIQLLKPSLSRLTFHFPQSLDVIFEATGNTQVTPRGIMAVGAGDVKRAPFSIININSGLVLPGSTRLFQQALPNMRISWWPKIYHVHFDYNYDGETKHQTYDTSFLYINVWNIFLTILTIAVIVWALSKLTRYNKHLRKLVRLKNKSARKPKVEPAVLNDITPESKTNRDVTKKIEIGTPVEVIHTIEVNSTTQKPNKANQKDVLRPQNKAKSARKSSKAKENSSDNANAA